MNKLYEDLGGPISVQEISRKKKGKSFIKEPPSPHQSHKALSSHQFCQELNL